MKKYCISQNNLKDKEKDAFIGPEGIRFIRDDDTKITYSTNVNNSTKSTFYILILDKMKVLQVETKACTVDLANKVHWLTDHDIKEQESKFRPHKYITYGTFDLVFLKGPGRQHVTESQTIKTGPLALHNNCQRSTHSISKWIFRNLAL